jgi:uncharacterized protein (DUF433 family)
VGDLISMLERPVYGYAETDRLLRVSPGTARRWINGYERLGRSYPPVVRQRPTDSAWVTWGEFVECRLLSEFRSAIPMLKLRPVVDWLREHVDEQYPLSFARPFLQPDGRELLLRAQTATGLDEELWMVIPAGQHLLMTATSKRFTQATRYPEDESGPAIAIAADSATPSVLLDPVSRQGQPSVRNVPTHTLADLVSAGETVQFVADTYDFPVGIVEEAVTYEASRRRAS